MRGGHWPGSSLCWQDRCFYCSTHFSCICFAPPLLPVSSHNQHYQQNLSHGIIAPLLLAQLHRKFALPVQHRARSDP